MPLTQTICPNDMALLAGNQGPLFAEVGFLTPVFEKSAIELNHKQKLLNCKSTVHIRTLNARTFNRIG